VKAFGNTIFIHPVPWLILPTVLVVTVACTFSTGSHSEVICFAVGATPMRRNCPGFRSSRRSSAPTPCPDFFAALAGVMLVARLELGQPTIGDDWLILSFAAPVTGGVVLAGGHVSVVATVLCVTIVAIIT